MKFLDTGEKIKKLRKELKIKQEELNSVGVSRNFISMIENGKRKLPKHVAIKLIEIFKTKANEMGIKLEIDEQWLLTSAKEQAINFCNEKLASDLSIEDIDLIIELIKDYNIKELIPKVYVLKANDLYDKRLYEEAFTYYYEILECVHGESEEKSFIYNKLSKCKIMMLNYVEAITYLNKCYEYCTVNGDIKNKKNCLYNMAFSYQKLDNIDLALSCINSYIKLCDIQVEFKEYMGAIILKVNCYILSKEYQLAIDTATDAINKIHDSENLYLGYLYNSLGVLYTEVNDFDKALSYLEKAEAIRLQQDSYNLSHTILNKAKIFIKQENIEEALQLINKTIALAETHNDYEFIIESYELLEKLYVDLKRNGELINTYLKMINLFNKMSKKDEALKIYVKLLSLTIESKDSDEYKYYLREAMKLV
ncbi:helix-turn-helix domain-containing protein [Clostridium sp.]|uniref:helix-turn-helix domain-containing protein n=1 Tax=Clostridium sp. TaxID=1506 RepID=UPI002FCC0873